jgi:formylglycine-generating enzyme
LILKFMKHLFKSFLFVLLLLSGSAGSGLAQGTFALKLNSPNGGESWAAGSTQVIKWSVTGTPPSPIVSFNLFLSTNNGSSYASNPINPSPISGSTNQYSWTLSGGLANTTQAKILVVALGAASATITSDDSDVAFTIVGTVGGVSAPVITPASGTIQSTQLITMTTSTVGAQIRYTLDGSDPTAASALYLSPFLPFSLTPTFTVKAKAFLGSAVSPTTAEIYTILTVTVKTPVISPPGGPFGQTVTVTITSPTVGSSFLYTTDGSEPSGYNIGFGTIKYTGPFVVGRSLTVKARGYANGMTPSDLAIATFTGGATSETVSAPTTPLGLGSGVIGVPNVYQTGGSISSIPSNAVQYRFNWGDGTDSGWLSVGTLTASKAWTGTSGQTFSVRAQARSVSNLTVDSAYSPALLVKVTTTAPSGQITSPVSGTTLTSPTMVFSWSGTGVTQYILNAGTLPGGSNFYSSGILGGTVLTKTVTGLPTNGQPIFVRLWSLVGNSWTYSDSSYTATSPIAETVAAPGKPTGNTTGVVATSYFFNVSGASSNLGHPVQYRFQWGDNTNSGWLGAGVQIATKVWAAAGIYNVTAEARCVGDPLVVSVSSPALMVNISASTQRITDPASGAVLTGAVVPFSWTGIGVTQYMLNLGSTLGGTDVYASGLLTGTTVSKVVSGIPTDGRALYGRLWSLTSSGWKYSDSSYTAFTQQPGILSSPLNGTTLPRATVVFNWTGSNVTQYALKIGTAAGLADLFDSGNLAGSVLTQAVPALATSGSYVYARLWSLVSGVWVFNDYAYPITAGPPGPVVDLTKFALIAAGTYQMGDAIDNNGDGNAPVHSVTVSGFYMGKTEVTKAEWDEVRAWGLTHGYGDLAVGAGKGATHPVQTVSWYDVVKWCNARSEKEGLFPAYYSDLAQSVVYRSGSVNVTNGMVKWGVNGYRLATEGEWEKAGRGGLVGKRFPNGNTIAQTLANYYGQTGSYAYDLGSNGYSAAGQLGGSPYTTAVGSYAPNGFGLKDMAGNVLEWCWDWYGTLGSGGVTDPRGADTGTNRVLRGGGWSNGAYYARVSIRHIADPSYSGDNGGFRVVRSLVP